MWRWTTIQNFFLLFTYELEKQILEKLLKWANKKQNNFNIYNADLKNTWRYFFTAAYQKNLDDLIQSFWDMEGET